MIRLSFTFLIYFTLFYLLIKSYLFIFFEDINVICLLTVNSKLNKVFTN